MTFFFEVLPDNDIITTVNTPKAFTKEILNGKLSFCVVDDLGLILR